MNSRLHPLLILIHNLFYMILWLITSGYALSRSIQPKKFWLANRVLSACILLMTKLQFCRL